MSEAQFLFNALVWGFLIFYTGYKLVTSLQIVPNRTIRIVERLGQFHRKLDAGFHVLIPWVDEVTYIHDLREQTIDVPAQQCFTLDNVRVIVDGVMYIQVTDAVKASFGVKNYHQAAMQLAMTTSRAIIATLELDRTFEERDLISAKVVEEVAKAGASWGIQVLRYEIKSIDPPDTVKKAMEMQVTAERTRRAIIAQSQGEMQSHINRSEGIRNELVAKSDGEKQRIINEAEGRAREIEALAEATASSIEKLAAAISIPGGDRAVQLRLSEAYLKKFQGLANDRTRVLLPTNLTNVDAILESISFDVDPELQRTVAQARENKRRELPKPPTPQLTAEASLERESPKTQPMAPSDL